MPMLLADSHLDLGYSALLYNRDLRLPVSEIRAREIALGSTKRGAGHNTVSLPELKRANALLCLATVNGRVTLPGNNRPDAWRSSEQAFAEAMSHASYYEVLAAEGWMRPISDRAGLDAHVTEWEVWAGSPDASQDTQPPLGYILAMEGADPIVGPWQLATWWAAGLRVISLVHYWFNPYAYGTFMDGGVMPTGRDLLAEMDRLGFALDISHLSDRSFEEALDLYQGPVLATHNTCRALVPGPRQLSDEQIRRLVERDAVIGVAMDDWMLSPDWPADPVPPDANQRVSLEDVANHIDHICQVGGSARHAAIGSDLDGGYGTEQTPRDLDTIADLHKLDKILSGRGYSEEDIEAVMYRNWIRFFREVLT